MKAIRGAITIDENTVVSIGEATQTLLSELASRNDLRPEEIVSAFFSLTPDLNAAFPAATARAMGWDVPMLGVQEVTVPGAPPRCLRVLIHVERNRPVQHAYLRGAAELRPELG
jgi:chorismate mutase